MFLARLESWRVHLVQQRYFIPTLLVVWSTLVAAGFAALYLYSTLPGAWGRLPEQWPDQATLQRSAKHPTLLVFAHPRCPCTIATMRELERLEADCPETLQIQLVMYRPVQADAQWVETPLVRLAKQIPRTHVVWDVDGQLAQQFGAHTSGHAMLFTPTGQLAFSGGLTQLRAHEGTNLGSQSIIALLHHLAPATSKTPVFGCPIVEATRLETPSAESPL